MKANKIIIEIGYNNECIFVTFKNEDVLNAIKKISKQYKDCIIYKLTTEY